MSQDIVTIDTVKFGEPPGVSIHWTGKLLGWTTGLKFYGEISKFLYTTTVS